MVWFYILVKTYGTSGQLGIYTLYHIEFCISDNIDVIAHEHSLLLSISITIVMLFKEFLLRRCLGRGRTRLNIRSTSFWKGSTKLFQSGSHLDCHSETLKAFRAVVSNDVNTDHLFL